MIVKELRAKKSHEMRSKGRDEDFKVLAEIGFAPMIAREEWKRNHTAANISTIMTVADEAFALLTMENNVNEWIKEAVHGKEEVTRGELTKYTSQGRNKDGTKKGWTLEGKMRYNEIYDKVVVDRNSATAKAKETWVRTQWRREEMSGGNLVRFNGEDEENMEGNTELQRRIREEMFVPRNGFVN